MSKSLRRVQSALQEAGLSVEIRETDDSARTAEGAAAAVGCTVPVPASFVRLELPVAFLFALLLVPLLRGSTTLSRGEGGLLLAGFAAWVVLEFALLG